MEALLKARAEGRVRCLGITGHHDPAVLAEALRRFEFDAVLVAVNAADRYRLSFAETVLPEAASRGAGVVAMKVYGGGPLVGPNGISAADAPGHALSLPGVATSIVGCRTPAEVEENVRIACDFAPFGDDQMRELETRTAARAAAFTGYKMPTPTGLH